MIGTTLASGICNQNPSARALRANVVKNLVDNKNNERADMSWEVLLDVEHELNMYYDNNLEHDRAADVAMLSPSAYTLMDHYLMVLARNDCYGSLQCMQIVSDLLKVGIRVVSIDVDMTNKGRSRVTDCMVIDGSMDSYANVVTLVNLDSVHYVPILNKPRQSGIGWDECSLDDYTLLTGTIYNICLRGDYRT